MKQYYIYKITNKINNRIYIGSHYGTIHDSYFGSGKAILKAIKKYGKENFKKDILEIFATRQLMLEREEHLLSGLNCATDPLYYNMTNKSYGGCMMDGKTLNEKKKIISEQTRKRKLKQEEITKKFISTWHNRSEEEKQKFSIKRSQIAKETYAKLTEEQKAARIQKITETKKNLPEWKKNITSKKHSEAFKKWWDGITPEQREVHAKRCGDTQRGKVVTQEHRQQIKKTLIEYNKNLPKHVREIMNKKNSIKMSMKKWCNDGVRNYRKTLEEIETGGYFLGKIKCY